MVQWACSFLLQSDGVPQALQATNQVTSQLVVTSQFDLTRPYALVQHRRESPSRPRLSRDQPQQSGTDGRPRTHSMAYALCPVAATTRKSTRKTRETSLKGLGIRPRRFAPLRNRAKFRPPSELKPRTQDGTCGSDQAPEQSVDRELGMGR